MTSRSDQLHSHQFSQQRAVAALAMRDPDPATPPQRRVTGALFASVMVALLAVAGAGVYGLVRPGTSGAWRDGGATIIERETGARYVFLDGTLHPVLNLTSAMLILGTSETVQVARQDLVDVPRGTPVGITGAPDPLPGRDQLVSGPWTLCSRSAGSGTPESVLRVGWAPDQAPLSDDGVLAADPTGGLHLLWHGRRFALRDPDVVLAAFAWAAASATTVDAALLNAIPAGPDLAPPAAPRSQAASALPGVRVGEVFLVGNPGGVPLHGVALLDGVSTVTAVQARLLLAAGANPDGRMREVGPADYAAARQLESLIPTGDDAPPASTPEQSRPTQLGGVCATHTMDSWPPALTVTAALPVAVGEVATAAGDGPGLRADHVAVPPGRGVVVEALAGAGAPTGALAVVSDLGIRFAIPSAEVLAMLGYGDVTPVRLPAALVALVPAGRALDPAAAVLPATAG